MKLCLYGINVRMVQVGLGLYGQCTVFMSPLIQFVFCVGYSEDGCYALHFTFQAVYFNNLAYYNHSRYLTKGGKILHVFLLHTTTFHVLYRQCSQCLHTVEFLLL